MRFDAGASGRHLLLGGINSSRVRDCELFARLIFYPRHIVVTFSATARRDDPSESRSDFVQIQIRKNTKLTKQNFTPYI